MAYLEAVSPGFGSATMVMSKSVAYVLLLIHLQLIFILHHQPGRGRCEDRAARRLTMNVLVVDEVDVLCMSAGGDRRVLMMMVDVMVVVMVLVVLLGMVDRCLFDGRE